MPIIFVGWAGNALYLSLVPAYLSASLHASDPLIGAGAFLATQISGILASIYFGNVQPERSGVVAPLVVVIGLVLLVTGTQQNVWTVIIIATILVGAGSGIASGAAYGITARVGQGNEHAPLPAYSLLRTPATACRPWRSASLLPTLLSLQGLPQPSWVWRPLQLRCHFSGMGKARQNLSTQPQPPRQPRFQECSLCANTATLDVLAQRGVSFNLAAQAQQEVIRIMSGQPNGDMRRPVALVTGATSGIGKAVALKLARDGFYLIVHGRDLPRGSATVKGIESNGGHGRFVSANLSIPSDVERLAAEVGDVDVLVNNAGFSWFGPTVDLDTETFDALFASNVRAAYFLVAALAPGMVRAAAGASSTSGAWPVRSAWPAGPRMARRRRHWLR